jgi:glycosyltransferase involved in cell wall biosynthesis
VKLSLVVLNYNYGHFVRQAIKSALAVDWPDKEVIVVDDGSTDHSRSIIDEFRDRVTIVFQPNGGQSSACNAGFDRCSGDVVIFLDSDDALFPSVANIVTEVWHDPVSKVQYSLIIVDRDLRPLGLCWPRYAAHPTPEGIREIQRKTGHYLHSPTSGNAWARRFLQQVFPLPVRAGDPTGYRSGHNGDCRVPSMDGYLSQLAPYFGDVICIRETEPQGLYRLHGRNYYVSNDFGTSSFLEEYSHRVVELMESARHVNETLDRLNVPYERINCELNEYLMRLRLICERWYRDYPLKSSVGNVLLKYWRAISVGKDTKNMTKAKWFIWSLLVTAGSWRVGWWAIRAREQRSVFTNAMRVAAGRIAD